MLGIEKVCLLPNECAVDILQFVEEWGGDVDDWAIFMMDATNCAFDNMRFDDDKVRAELTKAFGSKDADDLARAIIATLRLGEDGYEENIRNLASSKARYNPLVAINMQDMLLRLGCDQELFDAPQVPGHLEKLQELAEKANWVVTVDDDDKASLGDLAKWALNLMTI